MISMTLAEASCMFFCDSWTSLYQAIYTIF